MHLSNSELGVTSSPLGSLSPTGLGRRGAELIEKLDEHRIFVDLAHANPKTFWDAVAAVRPDLVRGFNPWDDLVSVDQLVDLYAASGIEGAQAELVEASQELRSEDDWWDVVMGTGFRGTVAWQKAAETSFVRGMHANAEVFSGG